MLDNIYILRDIINIAGGHIVGRKKLQKIIYIIQQLCNPFNNPYEYRWNYYGVFSEELASEIHTGKVFGIFGENYIDEYGYRTYVIEVIDSSNLSDIEKNKQLKSIVEFLVSKEPRVLEVISSIMYFQSRGLDKLEIEKKLNELKGHLSSFFECAFTAQEELQILMGEV
ncbi:MAG: hypothetical protein GX333_04425 [Syntrophomonadaceae bacterium]|nr:hypothetical protein [Syntrophomonadaceae bacterium]